MQVSRVTSKLKDFLGYAKRRKYNFKKLLLTKSFNSSVNQHEKPIYLLYFSCIDCFGIIFMELLLSVKKTYHFLVYKH